MEVVSRKWRVVVSSLHMCTWAIGCMLLSLVAYVIRDAFHLQLTLSIPSFILLLYL